MRASTVLRIMPSLQQSQILSAIQLYWIKITLGDLVLIVLKVLIKNHRIIRGV